MKKRWIQRRRDGWKDEGWWREEGREGGLDEGRGLRLTGTQLTQ